MSVYGQKKVMWRYEDDAENPLMMFFYLIHAAPIIDLQGPLMIDLQDPFARKSFMKTFMKSYQTIEIAVVIVAHDERMEANSAEYWSKRAIYMQLLGIEYLNMKRQLILAVESLKNQRSSLRGKFLCLITNNHLVLRRIFRRDSLQLEVVSRYRMCLDSVL